ARAGEERSASAPGISSQSSTDLGRFDRAASLFRQHQRKEQDYENDREQNSHRRQDRWQSPGVDAVTDEGAQEREGAASSQLRHGDPGRAERGGRLFVQRIQKEYAAQASADVAQEREYDPDPTEERGHDEIGHNGQDADGGKQRSPAVSLGRARRKLSGEA